MAYNDAFLVEKLREILLRLYPTPRTSLVLESPQILDGSSGDSSSSSSSSTVEEKVTLDIEGESVLGVVHNFSTFDHNESTTFIQGNYTLFPTTIKDNSAKVLYDTTALTRNLHEFIQVLKMSLGPNANGDVGGGASSGGGSTSYSDISLDTSTKDLDFNLTMEDILDLNNLLDGSESSLQFKHVLILLLYFLIACVAIVGNLLVVQLVIRSRRLHTLTHALLANLAIADLFMATLNIPFSAARVILAEWPFGSVLCHLVPFVQVTSVYVTSITMAVIAVDRYSVIMNPLGRRMKTSHGVILVLIIWILSGVLSLPYALHHKVVRVLTVGVVKRCQAEFGSTGSRRWLTIGTFLAQYLIPLLFTSISYISIMRRLRNRSHALGSTTPRQMAAQSRAKKRTIKMLALTVVFFAVSWAPINTYHLLTHFSLVRHNSTAILVCHIIAMSSSTINPFVYCWFNDHFRLEAQKWMRCFRTRRCPIVHPGVEVNGMLTRADRACHRTQSTTFAHSSGSSLKRSPCRTNANPQQLLSPFPSRSRPVPGPLLGYNRSKSNYEPSPHTLYESPLVEVTYGERQTEALFLVHSDDLVPPGEKEESPSQEEDKCRVEEQGGLRSQNATTEEDDNQNVENQCGDDDVEESTTPSNIQCPLNKNKTVFFFVKRRNSQETGVNVKAHNEA